VADQGREGAVHKLDNRGSSCSLGLLRVKQRLAEMPLGDVLEVVTRDRFAPYEVPAWVERQGLELVSLVRSGVWLFSTTTFTIRKTVAVLPPRQKVA
jgi:TusA-related sulfurtransferase